VYVHDLFRILVSGLGSVTTAAFRVFGFSLWASEFGFLTSACDFGL
jgi:hypothetical protein